MVYQICAKLNNLKANKRKNYQLPIMKRLRNILLSLFIISFLNLINGQESRIDAFLKITKIDEIDFSYKGSAWYADQDVVMVIGGVDSIDRLSPLDDEQPDWQTKIIVYPNAINDRFQNPLLYDLPFGPMANGASAIAPEGIYYIGGVSPKGYSRNVFKIKWNAELQEIKIDSLPPLPVTLTFAGAVYFQQVLYVAGVGNGMGNSALFILDLNNLGKGWEIQELPMGKYYNSPSLVVQGDGANNCLYVIGGLNPVGMSEKNLLKYNLKSHKWAYPAEEIKKDSTYFSGYGQHVKAIGNSSVLFFETNKTPLAESVKQSSATSIIVFNTITNAYAKIGQQLPFVIDDLISLSEKSMLAIANEEADKYALYEIKIIEETTGFGIVNSAVLVLYFLLMLLIGFYFSKKQKTANDYFKGGKKIPYWAAGLSLIGTGLSAISFMAVPAKAFATDWAYYMIRLTTILMPITVGLLYIPVFRGLDVSTAYEYLQRRFNLTTRLIGSFSFIIFQLGRIGIVLFLPAVALNVVTGFDVVACIIVVGVISMAYTVMGGIEAVIWTDVIQVIILYGGIILCVAFISFGLEGGVTDIISIGTENNKFNIIDFSFNLNEPNFWVVVFGSFFTNLTTYGSDQTMVQRYFTTPTTKDATKSIWTTVIIGFSLGWLFFFMGTALYAYYKTNPQEMLHTMSSNDAVFPWYIISQLPKGISGLLIAGIFAAAMSSLSSSMNSAATAYTMDFHQLFKKEFNAVTVGKIVTLIIGVGGILFAILFATLNVKSIWDEFLKIIGLMTGGLGGVFLLGIITKKANGAGVLIGLLVSAVVQYFVGVYHPFNLLLFTASGFITCFVVGYVFSILLPMYNKSVEGLTVYSVKKEN